MNGSESVYRPLLSPIFQSLPSTWIVYYSQAILCPGSESISGLKPAAETWYPAFFAGAGCSLVPL